MIEAVNGGRQHRFSIGAVVLALGNSFNVVTGQRNAGVCHEENYKIRLEIYRSITHKRKSVNWFNRV